MAFEEENKYNHLEELNGSDYQIVEGEPDITGWEVIDGEGRKIGEVDDVLFDPNTRDVRYIIVDLAENELEIVAERKVLIPIGIAEMREEYDDDDTTEAGTFAETSQPAAGTYDNELVDEDVDDDFDDEVVYLPTVTAAQLLALPVYEKGGLSPEQETAIRSVFEGPSQDVIVVYEPNTFYTHEHFNNKIYPTDTNEEDRMDLDDFSEDGRNRDNNL